MGWIEGREENGPTQVSTTAIGTSTVNSGVMEEAGARAGAAVTFVPLVVDSVSTGGTVLLVVVAAGAGAGLADWCAECPSEPPWPW